MSAHEYVEGLRNRLCESEAIYARLRARIEESERHNATLRATVEELRCDYVKTADELNIQRASVLGPVTTAAYDVLSPDAQRIVQRIIHRMAAGQREHGRLDLNDDTRDWGHEKLEELLDALVYDEFAKEQQRRRHPEEGARLKRYDARMKRCGHQILNGTCRCTLRIGHEGVHSNGT